MSRHQAPASDVRLTPRPEKRDRSRDRFSDDKDLTFPANRSSIVGQGKGLMKEINNLAASGIIFPRGKKIIRGCQVCLLFLGDQGPYLSLSHFLFLWKKENVGKRKMAQIPLETVHKKPIIPETISIFVSVWIIWVSYEICF